VGHVTRIGGVSTTNTTLLAGTEGGGHFTYLTLDGSIICRKETGCDSVVRFI